MLALECIKKEGTKILSNLLSNFVASFYRDWLEGIDFSHDIDFQWEIVKNTPSEDVKNILVIIEFGNEIQGEIDLYVTNNKLNEASLDKSLILSQKIL